MPTIDQKSTVEAQPKPEDWGLLTIENFSVGLDLSDRPELVKDGSLIEADNIRFNKSKVLIDYGYKTFGQVIRGNPRIDFQFFLKNGSSSLILLTDATFYVYNETTSEWEYVSDGTDTTLSANEAMGQTDISVTSDTGFSDGDFVGIRLNDGTQHRTTINGTPSANIITITDALPSASDSGKAFVKAIDLSGDPDITPCVATWAAFDKLYVTNGVDPPQEYDGSTIEQISNLPSSGNFAAAIVVVFNNYLHFFNTIEGGTNFPQRHRWSNPGSDSNFNESVNFNDLYDSEDFITAAQTLGTYLAVYKERSIYRLEFLGLADKTWNTIRTVDAEGARNNDAVINLGDEHLFFGNSNFYRYDGGFTIESIGDPIFDKIFAQEGELNPSKAVRSFGLYIEELDEAWWVYPVSGDDFCKRVVRFNVSKETWSIRKFTETITGFGFFQAQGDITWEQAAGTWEAYVGAWVSKAVQDNAPTIHLLGQENLQVYEYDYVTSQDNGSDIPYVVETKDYYIPNWELRFDRYEFKLKGSNILIEVSYDQGNSFETLKTVSPGNSFSRVRVWKQRIGRSIRFRFTGSDGFGLEWATVKYKAENTFRH